MRSKFGTEERRTRSRTNERRRKRGIVMHLRAFSSHSRPKLSAYRSPWEAQRRCPRNKTTKRAGNIYKKIIVSYILSRDQRFLEFLLVFSIKLPTNAAFHKGRPGYYHLSCAEAPGDCSDIFELFWKSILVSRLTSDSKKHNVFGQISDKALSQAMVVNIKSLRWPSW